MAAYINPPTFYTFKKGRPRGTSAGRGSCGDVRQDVRCIYIYIYICVVSRLYMGRPQEDVR